MDKQAMVGIDTLLTEESENQRFSIADDGGAQWAMRKIAQIRADTESWKAFYAEQLRKITEANQRAETYFTGLLSEYFEKVPKHETKTQAKYVLPCGELVRKKQAPEYVRNEAELLAFLAAGGLDEYVERKPSLRWNELKKACAVQQDGSLVETTTGLVLEGVTANARPDKFEVILHE